MPGNPPDSSPAPFPESGPPSSWDQQWQRRFPAVDGSSELAGQKGIYAQNRQFPSSPAQSFDGPIPHNPPNAQFHPSPSLSGISSLAEPRGLPPRPQQKRVPLVRPERNGSLPWRPTARLAQIRRQLAAPMTGQIHRNAQLSQRQALGLWGWFKQQDKNRQLAVLCGLVALLLLCSSMMLIFVGGGNAAPDSTSSNAPTRTVRQGNTTGNTATTQPTQASTPTMTATATPTSSATFDEPTPTEQPVQDNMPSTQAPVENNPTPTQPAQQQQPTPSPTIAPPTPTATTPPIILPIETAPADPITPTENAQATKTGEQ